jgi:Phosphatidylinositol 3- and 4-kinase
MDMILGNTDRHMGNVLFEKHGNGVKFIDNGMSFVSNSQAPVPAYYTHKDYAHMFNGKITPEFKSWVKSLSPEKFKHLLDIHGVPSDAKDMAMKRLEQAHKAIDKSEDHNSFFNKLKRSIF